MIKEQFSEPLVVRITPSLMQKLNTASAVAGISFSQYVRRVLDAGSDNMENILLLQEAVSNLSKLREINNCAIETLFLVRQQSMQNTVRNTQEKLSILGYESVLNEV